MKNVLVTGGFDPLHSGHIEYFNAAKKLGDKLIVGINSDNWLRRKKGKYFMPFSERRTIIENLSIVDEVINFDDEDNSANEAIETVLSTQDLHFNTKLIFANGGDRSKDDIKEYKKYGNDPRVEMVFGVGGEKRNSSSWLLQEWKFPKTGRAWGYYRILHENGLHVKVKELTVDPGKRLSMQKHQDRAEHWFVTEGKASVYTLNVSSDMELQRIYNAHESLHINQGEWHMLSNETEEPLKIIEIQYGERVVEDDIERVAIRGYD